MQAIGSAQSEVDWATTKSAWRGMPLCGRWNVWVDRRQRTGGGGVFQGGILALNSIGVTNRRNRELFSEDVGNCEKHLFYVVSVVLRRRDVLSPARGIARR